MRLFVLSFCAFFLSLSAHLLPCEGEIKISSEGAELKLVIPQREQESFPLLFPEKGDIQLKEFSEKNFSLKVDGKLVIPQLKKQHIEKKDLSRPGNQILGRQQEEIHRFDHFSFQYSFTQAPKTIEIIPPGNHSNPYLFGPQFFRFQVSLKEGAFNEKFFLQQETFLLPQWQDISKTKLYVIDEEDDQVTPNRFFGDSQIAHAYLYLQKHNARVEFLFPYDSFTHQIKEVNQKPRIDFETEEQALARPILEKILREKLLVKLNGQLNEAVQLDIKFIDFNANTLSHQEEEIDLERHNTLIAVSARFQSLDPIQKLDAQWLHESVRVPELNWTLFPQSAEKQRLSFKDKTPTMTYQSPQQMTPSHLSSPKVSKQDLDKKIWLTLISLAIILVLFCAITKRKHHMIATILMLIVVSRMAFLIREKHLLNLAKNCQAQEEVLSQIYHAQELYEEKSIYAHLAKVSEKELLGKLYLLVRNEQKQKKTGSVFSKIKNVKVTHNKVFSAGFTPQGELSFVAKVHWEVDAALEHWGHSHEKKQAYKAELKLLARDGQWKLTDFKLDQVEN